MSTRLSVNLNKVALLRNTRLLGIPSVTRAATLCLQAGAHGITVHPRPDERHIRYSDVREINGIIRMPAVSKYFVDAGMDVLGNTPEEFAASMKDEYAKTGKVIRDLGLKGTDG